MKGNTDKRHLTVTTDQPTEIRVGEYPTKNSTCEKLLAIDNTLNFNTHVFSKVFVRRQIII